MALYCCSHVYLNCTFCDGYDTYDIIVGEWRTGQQNKIRGIARARGYDVQTPAVYKYRVSRKVSGITYHTMCPHHMTQFTRYRNINLEVFKLDVTTLEKRMRLPVQQKCTTYRCQYVRKYVLRSNTHVRYTFKYSGVYISTAVHQMGSMVESFVEYFGADDSTF